MNTLIAFLRGINVGNIRIKMADLAVCFEGLGFKDVKTYLQTGNVIFKTAETKGLVKERLEKALSERFNYEAYVILVDFETLGPIISAYPFSRDDAHHAYVLFLANQEIQDELLASAQTLGQEIGSFTNGLYLKIPKGETISSPFSKILAKAKFKSTTTMRNIQTLEAMALYS